MERLDDKDWMLTRDGDMTTCLDECVKEERRGLGFIGSDRYWEIRSEWPPQVYGFLPLVETAVRFALATTPEKVDRLTNKLVTFEPIVIATTYPRTAQGLMNGLSLRNLDMPLETVDIDGSVEAAPAMFERVDAVLDVVNSGQTMRDNGLQIVWDNLSQITVGAVWRQDV